MATIKPLEDKVLVKVIKEEQKQTPSGLIIAGAAEEKPQEAEVIAVGPGIVFNNGERLIPDVSVGDKIFFAKYQGTEVEVDNEKYLILAYRDILAVIG